VKDAWAKEPMKRLRNWLVAKGVWDDAKEEAWKAECDEWMDNEVNAYLETKTQPVTAMFDYTFAEVPADLAKQRDLALSLDKKAH
jgi:pyruvate dehydrogenase E1 component alpha subunit